MRKEVEVNPLNADKLREHPFYREFEKVAQTPAAEDDAPETVKSRRCGHVYQRANILGLLESSPNGRVRYHSPLFHGTVLYFTIEGIIKITFFPSGARTLPVGRRRPCARRIWSRWWRHLSGDDPPPRE